MILTKNEIRKLVAERIRAINTSGDDFSSMGGTSSSSDKDDTSSKETKSLPGGGFLNATPSQFSLPVTV